MNPAEIADGFISYKPNAKEFDPDKEIEQPIKAQMLIELQEKSDKDTGFSSTLDDMWTPVRQTETGQQSPIFGCMQQYQENILEEEGQFAVQHPNSHGTSVFYEATSTKKITKAIYLTQPNQVSNSTNKDDFNEEPLIDTHATRKVRSTNVRRKKIEMQKAVNNVKDIELNHLIKGGHASEDQPVGIDTFNLDQQHKYFPRINNPSLPAVIDNLTPDACLNQSCHFGKQKNQASIFAPKNKRISQFRNESDGFLPSFMPPTVLEAINNYRTLSDYQVTKNSYEDKEDEDDFNENHGDDLEDAEDTEITETNNRHTSLFSNPRLPNSELKNYYEALSYPLQGLVKSFSFTDIPSIPFISYLEGLKMEVCDQCVSGSQEFNNNRSYFLNNKRKERRENQDAFKSRIICKLPRKESNLTSKSKKNCEEFETCNNFQGSPNSYTKILNNDLFSIQRNNISSCYKPFTSGLLQAERQSLHSGNTRTEKMIEEQNTGALPFFIDNDASVSSSMNLSATRTLFDQISQDNYPQIQPKKDMKAYEVKIGMVLNQSNDNIFPQTSQNHIFGHSQASSNRYNALQDQVDTSDANVEMGLVSVFNEYSSSDSDPDEEIDQAEGENDQAGRYSLKNFPKNSLVGIREALIGYCRENRIPVCSGQSCKGKRCACNKNRKTFCLEFLSKVFRKLNSAILMSLLKFLQDFKNDGRTWKDLENHFANFICQDNGRRQIIAIYENLYWNLVSKRHRLKTWMKYTRISQNTQKSYLKNRKKFWSSFKRNVQY